MRAPSQEIDFQKWYHRPMATITAEAKPNIALVKFTLASPYRTDRKGCF